MNAQFAIMLLKMKAESMTEEEVVDEVITDLQKFKEGGCVEEKRPTLSLHTLMMKWSGKDLDETMEHASEFQQAINIVDQQKAFSAESKKGI